MKVLVLDDDEDRHLAFNKLLASHYVVRAKNVQEAVDALCGTRFDMMFLDHDLCDYDEDGKEKTGYDVAKAIVAMPSDKYPDEVVVHSWNSFAAPIMVQELINAGIKARYQPFSTAWCKGT